MPLLLVVDDDPAIRAMFARALRPLGEVEEASGGALALRRLASRKFDLILLDLHMPMVDGFSVLESLSAKQGPNRDTPIFVVTADGSEQARIRAFRRHAIFVLSKPVHLATLLSLAESALKKAAQRASSPSDKPQANSPSDKPQANSPSDKPRASRPSDKPQANSLPDKPQVRSPSDKPQASRPSDKPQANSPPDRSRANGLSSDRPKKE